MKTTIGPLLKGQLFGFFRKILEQAKEEPFPLCERHGDFNEGGDLAGEGDSKLTGGFQRMLHSAVRAD